MKTKKSFQWNKVTPLSKYLAMVLLVALPFVGFWLGKSYEELVKPLASNAELTSQVVSEPLPTIIKKPGSESGWVKYIDLNKMISFEYPEGWDYDSDREILLSFPKDKFDEYFYDQYGKYYRVSLKFTNQKLDDYIKDHYQSGSYKEYKVFSKKSTKIGTTDVQRYKVCNTVSMFMKGGTMPPGRDCLELNFINFESDGFIQVYLSDQDFSNDSSKEVGIYKKVLSSIKHL